MSNIVKSWFVVCIWAAVLCLVGADGVLAKPDEDQAQAKKDRLGQHYGFGPMEILKLEWKLGEPIIADLNADGLNDLIFTNNRKARIDVLLQKKDFDPNEHVPIDIIDEDVNDIFGREKSWRFKRASYDLDVAASSMVVADLNADGQPDLAFYAKDGLRVVLQNGLKETDEAKQTVAEPMWATAKKIDIRGGLSTGRALADGDINGDGRIDLALLADDGVFVVTQKTDGTMSQPEKYPLGGTQPRQLHIADVDGDERMDMVIITGEQDFPVRVRYQNKSGKLGPEVRYQLPAPRAMEIARLGDGPASCFLSVSRLSGRVGIRSLGENTQREEYPVFTYPLGSTDSAENRDMVAADVDGDGLSDIVASDPAQAEFLLFRANATGGLVGPQRFPGLSDMRKLVAGDLDGSGKDTIVLLSLDEKIIALSRLSKGRLSFPEAVSIIDEPMAMDLGDINGDKRLDLVYVARKKKEKKYYLRTVLSVGRKKAQAGAELELTELKDKPLDLRVGDIDDDGRADVMIVRPYGPMLLVRQPKAGELVQVTKQDIYSGLVSDVKPNALSLAPLAEREATAVLLAKKNFARSVIFDADKGWQVVDQYQASDRQSNLVAAVACQLPGEKALAIVTYDAARGKLEILTEQDDGTYRRDRDIEVGTVSVKKILTGDFGGNSPLSILLCGTHKMILVPITGQTYLLQKLASFETQRQGVKYGVVAVGDVNADDLPELVLIDQGHSQVEILAFDAEGELSSVSKFKVFEEPRPGRHRDKGGEPRALRLGDVTGDGKNDLILLVHDRIIVYPQD